MNRTHKALLAIALLLSTGTRLPAQDTGIQGYWKEPGGSIIHVEPCGSALCATLVALSPSAPARVDRNNPDAALRQRTLCGLRIGDGFQQKDPASADNGHLYDPKSGKTYHGQMQSHGDTLDLRGYIGVALFGRTEKWTRTARTDTCQR